jgi:hypothetical protein
MFEIIAGVLAKTICIPLCWIIPIRLGLKWARLRGISPKWLWFGIHPLGGWMTFLKLRFYIHRVACQECHLSVPEDSESCPHCKAALIRVRSFRWSGNEVQCAGCSSFVDLNSKACPSCAAPIPKLQCTKCGSGNTGIIVKPLLPRVGVLLFLVGLGFLAPLASRTGVLRDADGARRLHLAQLVQRTDPVTGFCPGALQRGIRFLGHRPPGACALRTWFDAEAEVLGQWRRDGRRQPQCDFARVSDRRHRPTGSRARRRYTG